MSHHTSLAPSLHGFMAVQTAAYNHDPARHSGLSSSSSASSSSAAAGSTKADGATTSTMAPCASSPTPPRDDDSAHLPEELVELMFSCLDAQQLIRVAEVNRQWRQLHEADEFWRPLYARWYGDTMMLDETQNWKANFRARDVMLNKLSPSISLLAHPDRHYRVEAVNFLRQHCEFLKFLLPFDHGVEQGVAAQNGAQPPPPSYLGGVPPHAPLSVQALGGATPDPAVSPVSLFYSPQTTQPPPVVPGARQPLPGAHTLELRHAQHIVKDAIVNRGWRCLFEQMEDRGGLRGEQTRPRQGDATQPRITRERSTFPFFTPLSSSAAFHPHHHEFDSDIDMLHHHSAGEGGEEERKEGNIAYGSAASHAVGSASSSSSSSSSCSSSISHSLKMIEYGAVLVAWTEYPWLRFDAVSAEFDMIAQMVQQRMEQVKQERYEESGIMRESLPFVDKLQALHYILYTVLGYKGNEANYYDVRNSFLHFVIVHRTGIPISLSIVYMAVALRLGIQVDGVNSPGHFLLRVEDRPAVKRKEKQMEQEDEAMDVKMVASRRPSRGDGSMVDIPSDAAETIRSKTTSSSTSAAASSEVYYVDAFSGHLMTPQVTLDFLALFTRDPALLGVSGSAGDRDPNRILQLQVCSHAALFVRMYRNLMNLYQDYAYHRQRIPALVHLEAQQAAAYSHYEMEAYLHHSASQILELMRLSGESVPDVLTQMYIERFRYGGGMT